MTNRWKIPSDMERTVRERDLSCVYCRVVFTRPPASRRQAPSWEHIINDASIVTLENIALCCCSCNASKGSKLLGDWLNSPYCKSKNITAKTVARVVRQSLISAN
jgi:5-methylcytosine-specific restriction endonuclease McrA